ncbi:hypothetical protein HMI56_003370 [Coelomomyces lativittatus]|nr:hypothetical protein HMI56_003370 [Coelomomyces lativittatus]
MVPRRKSIFAFPIQSFVYYRALLVSYLQASKQALLVILAVILPFPFLLPGFLLTFCCVSIGVVLAFVLLGQSIAMSLLQLIIASIKWWVGQWLRWFHVPRHGSTASPLNIEHKDLETLYNQYYKPTQPSVTLPPKLPTLSIITTGRFNDLPLNSA